MPGREGQASRFALATKTKDENSDCHILNASECIAEVTADDRI